MAECLSFLKKELAEFRKEEERDDDDDLDTEKETSKQRAFTIIGKRPGAYTSHKPIPLAFSYHFIGTSLYDITMEEISIPPEAASLLGHRIVYTDTSEDLATGLEFVRGILRSITTGPHWGIVRQITVYAPCELLRCGGCIIDAPAVDDADVARARHLRASIEEADAVVMILSVSPLGHALRSLLERSGFLRAVQEDPTKRLAVIIPGDRFTKYMEKEKREEWEERHRKEKLDALRKSLIRCSRAQEKRSAVSAFMESSGRFKFIHFYRYAANI